MPKKPSTPSEYFASLPEPRKSEIQVLHKLIRKEAPKLKPWFLGSAHGDIVGYGKYEYKTKSGCKGSWFTVGLSNRKAGLTLYVMAVKNGKYIAEIYAPKLKPCKVGKSCITIKKLEDIDLDVVKKMVKEAEKYKPDWGG